MPETFTTKSDKEVLIRPIENTESDIQAALDFINALIEEDTMIARSGNPVTLEEQKEWVQKTTEGVRKKDKIFFAAFFDGRMVGNTQITRQGGRARHVGTFGISIAKDFRGEGLGKELMRRVLEKAPSIDISHIELHVYEGNEPAIQLYTSMGFKEVGRLPEAVQYKGNLITNIIMWKKIY
ncbi:MAG: GNAT family N-acetyltransferase [Patescibacteria group bacterium]